MTTLDAWDNLLGAPEEIRLNRDELMLLDWVLCTASSLMVPITDDLVDPWHEFRLRIWETMPEGLFSIEARDAKVLLTAVPTTFSWGTGEDCGFSLKTKLSQWLLGTYSDPGEENDHENASEAQSSAPSSPPAGC